MAAKLNNSNAYYNLGVLYYNGFGVERNFLKAFEYMKLAAEQNNSHALIFLGYINLLGICIDQDFLEAKKYFELAAKQNNSYAFYYLGKLYMDGLGVEQDFLKAKKYFELGAKNNDSESFFNLGKLYMDGLGVKQDFSKAEEYFTLLIKQNESNAKNDLNNLILNNISNEKVSDAYYYLGILYTHEKNCNFLKAKKYFELSININNNKEALNYLGCLYFYGNGVKKDSLRAIEYFELSAKQNYLNAICNLETIYLHGLGVKRDISKAKGYFQLYKNNCNAKCYVNLGKNYFYGIYEPVDILKAKKYFELAAKLNELDAYWYLSIIYLIYYHNEMKALEFLKFSVKNNETMSFFFLRFFYENSIEPNFLKANEYYQLSSRLNNHMAHYQIGIHYMYGLGVKKDYLKARDYFDLAALHNYALAFFKLGELYSRDDIFEPNLNKAINYFLKCSETQFDSPYNFNTFQNDSHIPKYHNYFFYRSHNDLGLIYLLFFQENDKAFEYIKTSANGEYPIGENNYGLVNQLYYKNLDEAEYRFKKASKSNLSIADFNLGQLYENQNKIPKSIEYYIRATKQNIILTKNLGYYHYDAIFNCSSKFIICYANLKVAEHYLSQNNYKEGKIYFMNSFSCLRIYEIRSYKFEFQFDIHKKEKVFSYLKSFIILHPIFNLSNQPFSNITNYINDLKLELNELKNLQIQSESNFKNQKRQEVQMHNKNNEKNRFNALYEKNKGKFSIFDEEIRNECLKKKIDDVRMFTDPSELFDFIINEEDHNLVKYLIEEIQEILCIIKKFCICLHIQYYLVDSAKENQYISLKLKFLLT